jgi:glycosyltransferase involved in cell wall biosynthesis
VLKVYFYLEFQHEVYFDFTNPNIGNPGIGGTEYATISLANELAKNQELQVCVISNFSLNLDSRLSQIVVSNLEEAMLLPILSNQYLIFRPRIDPEKSFLEALNRTKAKLIAWMHVTPSPKHLRILAGSVKVIGVVALGNRQFLSWLDNPISRKTVVIQNGQYPALRKANSQESNVITYLGALVPQKGFHVLAKAWPQVVNKFPHLTLHVIGGGNLYNDNLQMGTLKKATPEYESQILQLLGDSIDSVHFLGKISAKEKAEVIAKSYIGIVNPAGFTENCPASVLDFESAGVPVISARRYGLLDTVSHDVTGFLIKKEKDLAQEVINLYEDKLRRKRYAESASNYTITNFSFEKIVKEWTNFLRFIDSKDQRQSNELPKVINITERLALFNYTCFSFFGNRDPLISIVEIKIYIKAVKKKLINVFRFKK